MNGKGRKWLKQIGTGLMILIIGVMLINKVAYTHVHVLPNGSLVSHAHPFSNSAESNKNSSHQHSSLELYLLDILEVLIFSVIATIILKPSTPTFISREANSYRLLPVLVQSPPGRAPPTCM